jgi:hypothetical protein
MPSLRPKALSVPLAVRMRVIAQISPPGNAALVFCAGTPGLFSAPQGPASTVRGAGSGASFPRLGMPRWSSALAHPGRFYAPRGMLVPFAVRA